MYVKAISYAKVKTDEDRLRAHELRLERGLLSPGCAYERRESERGGFAYHGHHAALCTPDRETDT